VGDELVYVAVEVSTEPMFFQCSERLLRGTKTKCQFSKKRTSSKKVGAHLNIGFPKKNTIIPKTGV
jgi:hypothetical protein